MDIVTELNNHQPFTEEHGFCELSSYDYALEQAIKWRLLGGLPAALDEVRNGSGRKAVDAAIAIGLHLDEAVNAAQHLKREGTVRAMLRAFNNHSLTPTDLLLLGTTLDCMLKHYPDVCSAQLFDAFSDPDPSIAFVALFHSHRQLLNDTLVTPLHAAGVGSKLVAALSHPSPFCRSAAAIAASHAATVPQVAPEGLHTNA